ncbi:MAG: hypothetical protein CVV64_13645 [Candidatus Wallbacteria bacterium HGW-Wallbacteria-1]|jgi:hypothetical protein|uniref:Uncharacterized protein n=1 Tax=Candidatus Wallbacteria bacterium HGW-Wallbacteria-1 TaxID=2013854 RepID=A0A2N1PMP9_9BACT|nr:MAG: hypothetical protein CVV64_13645 [Candidatus Wallbacteria bacterium HGW-Wallbacteria-1]
MKKIIALFLAAVFLMSVSGMAQAAVNNRTGEVKIINNYSPKDAFDLRKGRLVSAYKGSFIIREHFFRPEFSTYHEFFKYMIIPVKGTKLYPLSNDEMFCEVMSEINQGGRVKRVIEATEHNFKSGVGFASKEEMKDFKFILMDRGKRLYAVQIGQVIGDVVRFVYRNYNPSECGLKKGQSDGLVSYDALKKAGCPDCAAGKCGSCTKGCKDRADKKAMKKRHKKMKKSACSGHGKVKKAGCGEGHDCSMHKACPNCGKVGCTSCGPKKVIDYLN